MTTNAETVANAYEAMNRGDIQAVLAIMDDDIEFRVAEHSPYWTGEALRGAQAVLDGVFAHIAEDYTDFRIETQRILEAGDTVVGQIRYHAKSNATGKELDAEAAHIFDFRNGKVFRFQQYLDTWQSAEVTGKVGAGRQTAAAT